MGYQPAAYVIEKHGGLYYVFSSPAIILGSYYTLRAARKRIKRLANGKDDYIVEKYDKKGNLIV